MPGLFSRVVIHAGDFVATEAIPLIHAWSNSYDICKSIALKAQDVVLVICQIPAACVICSFSPRYDTCCSTSCIQSMFMQSTLILLDCNWLHHDSVHPI